MKDKFGRTINYARISLTDKCNLRCVYCMPSDIRFEKDYINDNLSCDDYKFLVKSMAQLGITKVRYTGGEPLLYPNLVDLIRYTYECGIDEIGITTNGIGLSNMAYDLKYSGLKSVNISLDSLKEFKYKSITGNGHLKEVLKSIDTCISLGIKVKVNCVVIDGFNDDELYDFILLTKYKDIDVRFIELMPLGEAKKIYNYGYFNIAKYIDNIDWLYQVDTNEKSTANYYKFEGSKGRIGVITPMSCSFCNDCNRIRITSHGTIKPCLHSKEEIDVKYYINKPLLFREMMKDVLLGKPQKHYLVENQSSDTDRKMYQIGG